MYVSILLLYVAGYAKAMLNGAIAEIHFKYYPDTVTL